MRPATEVAPVDDDVDVAVDTVPVKTKAARKKPATAKRGTSKKPSKQSRRAVAVACDFSVDDEASIDDDSFIDAGSYKKLSSRYAAKDDSSEDSYVYSDDD